jgi:hypothetical protein
MTVACSALLACLADPLTSIAYWKTAPRKLNINFVPKSWRNKSHDVFIGQLLQEGPIHVGRFGVVDTNGRTCVYVSSSR